MVLCNLLYESEDCNQLAVFQRWKLGREGAQCRARWSWVGKKSASGNEAILVAAGNAELAELSLTCQLNVMTWKRSKFTEDWDKGVKKSETPAKHIGTISIGTKACRVNWDRTWLISGFIFALASYFLNLQFKAWFWKFSQFPQDAENIIILGGNANGCSLLH